MRKIHQRDKRLRNNAGMDFPLCRSEGNKDGLLDTTLGLSHETTGDPKKVTCKRCIKKLAEYDIHLNYYPRRAPRGKVKG